MPEFEVHSKAGKRLNWPQLEVARSQYPYLSATHKFGSSTSLTTAFTPVAIGSVYPTPQSTGASLEVVSSSTNDSTSGTGAHKLTVIGLSTAWAEISEEATFNGTTPVALSNKFTRVYRTYVSESGTYASASAGSHTGALDVQVSGAGALWSRISNTLFPRGQSQIGSYTVPLGKTAYITLHFISVNSNKAADFILFQRSGANETASPYTAMRVVGEYVGMEGFSNFTDITAMEGPFSGPCDIGFMAKAVATAQVSVEFEVLLVDNGD